MEIWRSWSKYVYVAMYMQFDPTEIYVCNYLSMS